MNTTPLLSIAAPLLVTGAAHAQTILIQEDFSTNPPANTPTVTWSTTDSPFEESTNPYEIYSRDEANDRGMDRGYDDDNDPSTDSIQIPGALEVNGEVPDVTLTATITLPGNLDTSAPGTLSFYAGTRTGSGEAPTLTVTTQSSLALIEGQDILTPSNSTTWEFFTYPIDLSTAAPGESLTIDWTGGGAVDDQSLATRTGLQLTGIRLVTQPVPEPTAAVLSLFGFGLLLRRR